jgi:histidinol-phosphate aminotransferase
MKSAGRFTRLAAPGVRKLEAYVPGMPVEELQRELGIRDVIKLASNENPLGPSPSALSAARDALAGVAAYPDGSGYHLRHALAARLAVRPEQITLGNGSNEILVLLAETFLTPRTQAVYSQFSFLVYQLAVQATGAVARVTPAGGPESSQPLGHDLVAMARVVGERTRMVFIANPNNPTGTWLEAPSLRRFIEKVPPHVIVVLDEAYYEYVDGIDYPRSVDWLGEFPNLVITRTFSKIFGLAGLRIGYAVSSAGVAELLNRVRQPFNVNSVAQAAALAALDDESHVTESRQVNARGLAQLQKGFGMLGLKAAPSAGNFLLLEVGFSAGEVYGALLRAGVIVRPVANYGLPDHLRITVGRPEQNERLLISLAAAIGAGITKRS